MTDSPLIFRGLYFYVDSSYIKVSLLGKYCDKSYKKNYIYKSSLLITVSSNPTFVSCLPPPI